jgi:hypothetical protein
VLISDNSTSTPLSIAEKVIAPDRTVEFKEDRNKKCFGTYDEEATQAKIVDIHSYEASCMIQKNKIARGRNSFIETGTTLKEKSFRYKQRNTKRFSGPD